MPPEDQLQIPEDGEVLQRRNFPHNTLSFQDGFELPNLKTLAKNFIERSSNARGKEKPLGWFITFFSEDENGDETWRATYISEIKVEELYMTMEGTDSEEILFDENWFQSLGTFESKLHLDNLGVEPKTIRLSHYRYASNHARAWEAAQVDTQLGIEDMSEGRGYGVGVIKGYRRNLRAAYMDYGTILQIHHAYELYSGSDNGVDNLRFVFTGAEINYGDMVSPAFQRERYAEWIDAPDDLDPSICSTLKIEAVYKHKVSLVQADGTNVSVDRYKSVGLYPGANTIVEGVSEDRTETELISLPGLFILPSCKRFWEVIARIQGSIVPPVEQGSYSKMARNNEINTVKSRKAVYKNIGKLVTSKIIKKMVGNGEVKGHSD